MHHVYILACPPGKNTKKNVFHNAATRPQNAPFLRGLCPVRTHKTRSAAAAFLGATVASWQRGSPAADPHPGPDPDLAAAAFLGAAAGHQDATVAAMAARTQLRILALVRIQIWQQLPSLASAAGYKARKHGIFYTRVRVKFNLTFGTISA